MIECSETISPRLTDSKKGSVQVVTWDIGGVCHISERCAAQCAVCCGGGCAASEETLIRSVDSDTKKNMKETW